MRRETRITVAVVCFLLAVCSIKAELQESIPLRLSFPRQTDWPVHCGVPFQQGQLLDTAGLRIVDELGKTVPSQISTTATWLQDGSVRWLLASFHAAPENDYRLIYGKSTAEDPEKQEISIKQQDGGLLIDTGVASFTVADDSALISEAVLIDGGNPHKVLTDSGRGAYLVDQLGRRARLGGPGSEMQTSFLVQGSLWSVLRKEGWYVTDEGSRVARGIVWLHFHGGSPQVKLVHRLVLTENTNKTWFKDIGIEFRTAFEGRKAAFDVTPSPKGGEPVYVELASGSEAWMLQDDYPHYLSRESHYAVKLKEDHAEREIASGEVCGDWCELAGQELGLGVSVRDFAPQFPKDFTVTPQAVTVRLWSERSGRELDFRFATLINEYWGDWSTNSTVSRKELAEIYSDAASSAKTHTLWLLPFSDSVTADDRVRRAETAAHRVLAFPEPGWTCNSGTLGAPMRPRDTERFPQEEAYISDFFDRIMYGDAVCPSAGYIAFGNCPTVTGTGWFRCNGLVDYHMRRNTWSLFARSGERKYFEYGERFNRFAGDMAMHHWDTAANPGLSPESQWPEFKAVNRKVKGGFASEIISRKLDLKGASFGDLPCYWGWGSGKVSGGSGVDLFNNLYQFYFTGDWEILELAEMYAEAIKKHSFLQTPKPHRGVIELRYITALYSMQWDAELGEMARSLAHQFIDLESPCGIYEEMSPTPLYKTGRNLLALYDYYRLTNDQLVRKGIEKIIEYKYRFQMQTPPFAYQSIVGWENVLGYWLTGQEKFLRIAMLSNDMAMQSFTSTLAEDLALPENERKGRRLAAASHFNYHACLSTPLILRAKAETPLPAMPFPLLRKYYSPSTNVSIIVRKQANKALRLEGVFNVYLAEKPEFVVCGPDLQPVSEYVVQAFQQGIVTDAFAYGLRKYFAAIELPATLPEGDYRIGTSTDTGPEGFVVSDCSETSLMLECPEGFWLGRGGLEELAPFYFHVPQGMEQLHIFTSSPVTISDKRGNKVEDTEGKVCGELRLPAPAEAETWRISTAQPALVRLLNLPPYVAYQIKEALFFPEHLVESEPLESPAPPMPTARDRPFSEGRFANGLALSNRRGCSFPRGEGSLDTGYQFFPGRVGTIEFYFRPNWSAFELETPADRRYRKTFLHAGDLSIMYQFGQPPYENRPNNAFMLMCGKTFSFEKRPGRFKEFGNHGRYWPSRGEWIHLAFAWDVSITAPEALNSRYRRADYKRGEDCETFWIFINGRKQKRISVSHFYPIYLHLGKEFPADYNLNGIAERITISGFAEGIMDELRISDCLRYKEDFMPPTAPFTLDGHTLALFHWDGELDGTGRDGQVIPVNEETSQ